MQQRDLEELLRSSIIYALKQAKFNRPQTHDATERDAYYRRTAELVMEHLRLSGWALERPQVLRKSPPAK